MKKLLTILLCLPLLIMAQAPQGFTYQGVATDNNGFELQNQSISIQASILSSSATGTTVWQETHTTTTDTFGLFNVTIGEGISTNSGSSATFQEIDWGASSHFMKVEIDVNGGSNYVHVGTSQMMSVPYALYAENSKNADNANNINDSISVSQYGDTLYILDNFLIIPGLSQSNLHYQFNNYGSVTDGDGNIYKTLIYGDNEWMVQNLKTQTGDYKTVANHQGSFQSFADSVGYYYSYASVANNVCPSGWHVATVVDWQDLHYEIFGTSMNPSGYTNAAQGYDDNDYEILWSHHQEGTNTSAFNLIRAGHWSNAGGNISGEPESIHFWAPSMCSANGADLIKLIDSNGQPEWSLDVACNWTTDQKTQVRCVKD